MHTDLLMPAPLLLQKADRSSFKKRTCSRKKFMHLFSGIKFPETIMFCCLIFEQQEIAKTNALDIFYFINSMLHAQLLHVV